MIKPVLINQHLGARMQIKCLCVPGYLAWAARAAVTTETAAMSADHRATTANVSMTGHSAVIKK